MSSSSNRFALLQGGANGDPDEAAEVRAWSIVDDAVRAALDVPGILDETRDALRVTAQHTATLAARPVLRSGGAA